MNRKISPLRRAFIWFLCAQPVLWTSDAALAQSLVTPRAQVDAFGAPTPSADRGAGERPLGVEQGRAAELDPGRTADADAGRAEAASRAPGAEPVALDAPLDPDAYVLGAGDVLDLNFWGIQNFKLRVTVDLEGRAFVPRLGYFELRGRTLTEARRILRDSVGRIYARLQFDATVAQPRTFLVQVAGGAARPGAYRARAVDRVATVIARAGGLAPNASRRRIEVVRRDRTTVRADLMRYAVSGDVASNPFVLDGDVVRVPFEDLSVEIQGAVNRPGRYELTTTRDLAELLELAGGLAPTATRFLPVTVVRRLHDDRGHLVTIPFPADGLLPNAPIQHDDVVRVPAAADLQQSVLIVGAIAGGIAGDETTTTKRLSYVEGDTVRMLLERAGGLGPLADLGGAYILRGGAVVPVDLNALWVLRDIVADRPVELGDTLIVPFKRRNIQVSGAVFTPGSFLYNPNYNVDRYVELAGGRNRFARASEDVRVITPDGKSLRYDPSLKIEPGSSVVVPERNFSRSEVVQIVLAGAGILLSGAAVILSVR
jgi:polysaccharide biosynthesis/export protein